jgi:hypothetical protein
MQTPVSEEELEDYELYIEPFAAYRSWAVFCDEKDNKVKLRSITYRVSWPSGEPMEATCIRMHWGKLSDLEEQHTSPDSQHSCGIHAVKDPEDAIRWMASGRGGSSYYSEVRCYGEVKLWGKVLRYTKGYLAQFAYPTSLYLDPESPENFPIESREAVKELRRTYRGVEVRLM